MSTEAQVLYVPDMAKLLGRTEAAIRSAVARGGADWQLRPYYVCRQVSPTGWEQLHASEGGIARFETMSEAQEAADAANAARA